jgi:hypothetical protein
MKKDNLLIVPQPVQAATSTRTSATGSRRSEAKLRDAIGPRKVLSERAQEPTRAWAGCGR